MLIHTGFSQVAASGDAKWFLNPAKAGMKFWACSSALPAKIFGWLARLVTPAPKPATKLGVAEKSDSRGVASRLRSDITSELRWTEAAYSGECSGWWLAWCGARSVPFIHPPKFWGQLAQLVRARRSHRRGHRFNSCVAHVIKIY